jgi:hypothetical protein
MTYPSRPAAIETELAKLATDFPAAVTVTAAPNKSPEGRTISYLRVTTRPTTAATPGVPVLVTGGHHAREFAPPGRHRGDLHQSLPAARDRRADWHRPESQLQHRVGLPVVLLGRLRGLGRSRSEQGPV